MLPGRGSWTSRSAADRLADTLIDPHRQRPVLVLSVPEDATEPTRPLLDPESLAEATFGLATVVVLPAIHTWCLTERFGDKRHAVYWGAVRLYLPDFRLDGDNRNHRLIMADWLEEPADAKRNRADLLWRIGASSRDWQPAWSFETIREQATAERTDPVADEEPADPEPVAEPSQPEQLPEEAPAPELPPASETPIHHAPRGWRMRLGRWLAGFFPPRESGEEFARAKQENEALRMELEQSEKDAASYFAEWEQADERAKEAERRRNGADNRKEEHAAQLIQQLKNHNLVPVPANWKEMIHWCETEFGERLELLPGAVKGMKKAEFEDPWLAAECLAWLAGPTAANNPDIKKDVNSTLTDGPAGKDVHFPDWKRVPPHERRNIKRGKNRERRNCLRIYYHWDDTKDRIVIVSMPHHAQTRLS